MPYLTGESGAAGLFPRVVYPSQGVDAAGGLLDRDCLAGIGVAARVAAWQKMSAAKHRVEIQEMLEKTHPWVAPSGAREKGTVAA